MTRFQILAQGLLLVLCLSACSQNQPSKSSNQAEASISRIAFGSCANQDKPQPMLTIATALQPDAFIFLGDNIYGDSRNMDTLKAKYARLGAKPEFQQLKQQAKVLAVWDDHDFGENDAGRHYPFKAASKEVFLDFWDEAADSDRRKHPGIYHVDYLKTATYTIQFILLDTRTFRDDLIHRDTSDKEFKNDYVPNQQADSTFLGDAQWQWLEAQLQEPASVRIIASSNQFSHAYNGWESWTNVPHERAKMIRLIRKTKANGVLFISGDVHWGEISKLETGVTYPIYDVTSSGITQTWDIIEPNHNRMGKPIPQNNIGLIEIQDFQGNIKIDLAIYDSTGLAVVKHPLTLEEISF